MLTFTQLVFSLNLTLSQHLKGFISQHSPPFDSSTSQALMASSYVHLTLQIALDSVSGFLRVLVNTFVSYSHLSLRDWVLFLGGQVSVLVWKFARAFPWQWLEPLRLKLHHPCPLLASLLPPSSILPFSYPHRKP